MTFKDLVNIILTYINNIVVLIVSILIALFIINIIKGIAQSENSEGRKKLKDSILYGIIGIFFAISFFAVAKWLAAGFGI